MVKSGLALSIAIALPALGARRRRLIAPMTRQSAVRSGFMEPSPHNALRRHLLIQTAAVFAVALVIASAVAAAGIATARISQAKATQLATARWLANALTEVELGHRGGSEVDWNEVLPPSTVVRGWTWIDGEQKLRASVSWTGTRWAWADGKADDAGPGAQAGDADSFWVVRLPVGEDAATGDALGQIIVTSDLRMATGWSSSQLLWAIVAWFVALAAVLPGVAGLFRQVFQLWDGIGQAVGSVVDHDDYGTRAFVPGDAMLDPFIEQFNVMLALIEQRDRALEEARVELEQRVRERTSDLELALNRVEMTAAFLRDRENMLRTVLDAAADGVVVCDATGKIISANRAASQMFAEGTTGLRGSPLATFMALGQRGEDPRVAQALASRRWEEEPPDDRCRMFVRRASSVFPVEVAISVVEANEQKLYTWIIRDVTDVVIAEEQRVLAAQAHAEASHVAGMAEMAAGVLHNVGNILNSINTSAALLRQRLHSPALATLSRVADFIHEHVDEDGVFIASDERGRAVGQVLSRVVEHLDTEWQFWRGELERLTKNIEHTNQVVASHQSAARGSGVMRRMPLEQLMSSVLNLVPRQWIAGEDVEVRWNCERSIEVEIDLHKVLQILVNLVKNASESVREARVDPACVVVVVELVSDTEFMIEVRDNGLGISPGTLAEVFSHGFTTKEGGHGFGLHNSANAATEMGGSLTAASEGVGQGACFTLVLPMEQRRVETQGRDERRDDTEAIDASRSTAAGGA